MIARLPSQFQSGLRGLFQEANRSSNPDNIYIALGQAIQSTIQSGLLSRREILQLCGLVASSGAFHLLFPKVSHAGGVMPFGFWGSGARTQGNTIDPHAIYRTLMIRADGATTGALNSFFDSSSNQYSVTKQGTPVQGTFSPFSAEGGKWSNVFGGSGDYLSISGVSASGTGDFTYEAWIYPRALSNSMNLLFDHRTGSGHTTGMFIYVSSAGKLGIYSATESTGTVSVNQWNHVAFVRSSGTLTYYINGASSGSVAFTRNNSDTTCMIGTNNDGASGYYWNGYLSNVRYARAALYSGNFTPAVAPLTAVTGTSLLIAQDNYFKDRSSNNYSITVGGAPKVVPKSPFQSTTTYSAATQGGSTYFCETAKHRLEVAMSSNFTTGFTCEAWVYRTRVTTTGYITIFRMTGGEFGSVFIYQNVLTAYFPYTDGTITVSNGDTVIPAYAWTHVALTVDVATKTGKLWVNGKLVGTDTVTSIGAYNGTLQIGDMNESDSRGFAGIGYLSGIRWSNSVRYTADFQSSLPTAPFSSDAGTKLLIQSTNADLIDHACRNQILSVGTPVQGTFSPFSIEAGKWSCYFDGTGDSLTIPDQTAFNLSSGDFTIEAWVNATRSTSTWGMEVITNVDTSDHNWGLCINRNTSSARIHFFMAGVITLTDTSSSVFPSGWHHLAVTRSGSTFRVFLDGVQVLTGSSAVAYTHYSNPIYIGNDVYGNSFSGHISNVRVIKGTALYTSNFTVPTSPLTAVTNAVLLTCQTNQFKDYSTSNFTLTPNGDSRVVPFGPFQPTITAYSSSVHGGSVYLNGTTDYLQMPQPTPDTITFSGANFSVDAWVFPTAAGNRTILVGQCDMSTAGGSSFIFYGDSSRTSDLYVGTVGYAISSPQCIVNQWNHVAFVRTDGTFSSYLNGSRVGTRSDLGTQVVNVGATTYLPAIGGCSNVTRLLTGYLSSLRVINGTGGYDATQTTISIPTQPPSLTLNSTLLANFTNAPIIDSTRKNNLMRTGTAQVSATTKKYGAGSLYLDGASNLTFLNSHALFDFGSGDYTIEFWINYVVKNSANNIFVPVDYGYGITGAFQVVSESAGNLGIYTWGGGSADGWIATYALSNFSTGTWYHVAFTRSNGTTNLYINGTNVSTSTKVYTGNFGNISLYIGGKTAQFLNAYLDNFTILKGKALYTGATVGTNYFTPADLKG